MTGYIREIDGMRALAVLAVVVFHLDAVFLPGGFSGVDVFFVISGYVVTKSVVDHQSRHRLPFHKYLVAFYARRVVRIFPALIVMLLITSLATVMFIPESWLSQSLSKVGIWAFAGLSNFALVWHTDGYFSPRTEFNPYTHTWSLGVEEQFYIVAPLILFIWLASIKRESSWRVCALAAMPLLGLASLWISAQQTSQHPMQAYYLLPARFWELAAGAWLFQMQHSGWLRRINRHSLNVSMWLGATLVTIGFVISDKSQFPWPWALLAVIGTSLMLLAITHPNGRKTFLHSILASSPIVYIGKLSYSLYLWHWPVYTLMRWTTGLDNISQYAIAILLSFTFAALSYHLVENPSRNHRQVKLRSNLWKVSTGVTVVSLCALLVWQMYILRPKLSLSVTADTYAWQALEHRVNDVDPNLSKRWSERSIFVVGNSHTGAYSTLLNEVKHRYGVNVHKFQIMECPVVHLLHPQHETAHCRKVIENLLHFFYAHGKPGDIIFFASLRTHRIVDQWIRFGKEHASTISHSQQTLANIELAQKQAIPLLEKLNELKFNVIIDEPKPVFDTVPYRCSDWFNRHHSICGGNSIDKEFLMQISRPVRKSIEQIRGYFPHVYIWRPFDVLCPDNTCNVKHNGQPLFFDGDHLSGYGNRFLLDDFVQRIEDIWES